jgi:hypothetical protein
MPSAMPAHCDDECGTCGKTFAAGRQARDNHCHATGHSPAQYECGTCGKVFAAGRQALDNHCRSTGHSPTREASSCGSSTDAEPSDDEDLECRHDRYCHQTWRTAADRVQHEAVEHSFCGDCGQYFCNNNNAKMVRSSLDVTDSP